MRGQKCSPVGTSVLSRILPGKMEEPGPREAVDAARKTLRKLEKSPGLLCGSKPLKRAPVVSGVATHFKPSALGEMFVKGAVAPCCSPPAAWV